MHTGKMIGFVNLGKVSNHLPNEMLPGNVVPIRTHSFCLQGHQEEDRVLAKSMMVRGHYDMDMPSSMRENHRFSPFPSILASSPSTLKNGIEGKSSRNSDIIFASYSL